MVLNATNANYLTTTTIAIQNDQLFNQEVWRLESDIRNAANRQLYHVVFNARYIGNPLNSPDDSDTMTDLQIAFRDLFISEGYQVQRDPATGYWRISWATVGNETTVSVYSIRTTVTPGAIVNQTIQAINNYFLTTNPVATSRTVLISTNGGDIDETEFGATASVFYEYVCIVQHQTTTDRSADILAILTAAGLGYDGANTEVYKTA